jgi:YbbR domain-containing protein
LNIAKAIISVFQFDRTNWRAVMLCFLAASVFWIFNALNKEHTANISFPIVLAYDQAKYVPVASLPSNLILNVTGNGWDIVRRQSGFKVPILNIAIEKPADFEAVPGNLLSPLIAPQLSSLKLNFVSTDTLRVLLDERFMRKIKAEPDLSKLSFKEGFARLSPVIILPDSIEIEGPKDMVKEMADSITIPVVKTRVEGNYRATHLVTVGDASFLKSRPEKVEVMFDVGAVVQIEKWIKLLTKDLSSETELKNDSDSVRAVFQVPARDAASYASQTWYAELDPAVVKKGETRKLVPSLMELPMWTKVLSIDSVVVKRY